MDRIILKSVKFNKLKGLQNVELCFEKPLTAIMGVNGAGKTTVIHALACIYRPESDGKGEDHRFPEFFVPNTDALWNGSNFDVKNIINDKEMPYRHYAKKVDRWNPRHKDRPQRNVYYLGIDSCMPEIEKTNLTTRIAYSSIDKVDKVSQKVITGASVVLNKPYETLKDNTYKSKHFIGVKIHSGLIYSSLSMGTGEQRTIKILEKIIGSEAYSLILIDEIDLLLHVSALRRLVKELYKIAINKHLQIVFTTHSLEFLQLTEYVGIQYIDKIEKDDGTLQMTVYDKPSSDIIRGLTQTASKPITIFVEDNFSKAIIKTIIRNFEISNKVDLKEFGAAQNAFSLLAGQCISGAPMDNTLIVLDGDVYRTEEEKKEQIKKVYTGTEKDMDKKREDALASIIQYDLPEGTHPEKFMHELLIQCDADNEIVRAALRIQAVEDEHKYISSISEELGEELETLVDRIVKLIGEKESWGKYILPIKDWIEKRKDL